MDKTVRLKISAQQKAVLKKYHDEGMISTRREMGSTIRECAAEVSMSEEQVKVQEKKKQ